MRSHCSAGEMDRAEGEMKGGKMEDGEVSCFAGELEENATAATKKKKEKKKQSWRWLILLAFRVACSCRDRLYAVRQIFCEKGNRKQHFD